MRPGIGLSTCKVGVCGRSESAQDSGETGQSSLDHVREGICSSLTTLEQPKSQRAATFATQGSTYAKLYIDLLRKLQKVDTVQAVLVGISNMLAGKDAHQISATRADVSTSSQTRPTSRYSTTSRNNPMQNPTIRTVL